MQIYLDMVFPRSSVTLSTDKIHILHRHELLNPPNEDCYANSRMLSI